MRDLDFYTEVLLQDEEETIRLERLNLDRQDLDCVLLTWEE